MAEIIAFPRARTPDPDDLPEIDVITALDVAIRDLREIAAMSSGETRARAEACGSMLERTFHATLQSC
ncbi:MAG TPA: hypothetical protein VMP03_15250 [Methylomirabilota bacterium]|nr:hypothetical protein [Methylomirabilota bacterium]